MFTLSTHLFVLSIVKCTKFSVVLYIGNSGNLIPNGKKIVIRLKLSLVICRFTSWLGFQNILPKIKISECRTSLDSSFIPTYITPLPQAEVRTATWPHFPSPLPATPMKIRPSLKNCFQFKFCNFLTYESRTFPYNFTKRFCWKLDGLKLKNFWSQLVSASISSTASSCNLCSRREDNTNLIPLK